MYNTETLSVEESIKVRFDDKLGRQKSKQGESFADIEVQIAGTEVRTSENKSSEIQPNSKKIVQMLQHLLKNPFRKDNPEVA